MTEVTCSECDAPADWIRHTQFAGDHPFCDAHARAEKDFGKDDSYAWWEALHGEAEAEAEAPEVAVPILEEGTVAPGQGYTRRTDAEIKNLALDAVEGRVFGSWMIAEHDMRLLGSIFMPLNFIGEVQLRQMEVDRIVHVYSEMSGAAPRSINGYPIFFSMRTLDSDDAQRLNEQIERLVAIRKQFLAEDGS